MKKNVGMIDRLTRSMLAIVVVVLYFAKQITGTAAVVLGIIAVAWLVTGVTGFCPLYVPLKFSTNKRNKGS